MVSRILAKPDFHPTRHMIRLYSRVSSDAGGVKRYGTVVELLPGRLLYVKWDGVDKRCLESALGLTVETSWGHSTRTSTARELALLDQWRRENALKRIAIYLARLDERVWNAEVDVNRLRCYASLIQTEGGIR